MYSGKAIEGRYYIAVCDLKRGAPFFMDEIRLTDNGDNWREGIKSAIEGMVAVWNKNNPGCKVNLADESVRSVHYAMKHRSKERGFILTHSFAKCRAAAARYFVAEAEKAGYAERKERERYGRRNP